MSYDRAYRDDIEVETDDGPLVARATLVDYSQLPLETLEAQLSSRGLGLPGSALGVQSELRASLRQDDLAHNLEPRNYDLMGKAELTELSTERRIRPRRTSRQTLEKLLQANDETVLERLRYELAIAVPGTVGYARLQAANVALQAHGVMVGTPTPRAAAPSVAIAPRVRGRALSREAVRTTPATTTRATSTQAQVVPLDRLSPSERLALMERVMSAIYSARANAGTMVESGGR